jgi:hypothetical protein
MAIQLILLTTALSAVIGLGFFFASSPSGAAWVLVAAFVGTQALIAPLELETTVAGYTVYALDPIAGTMLIVGVLGLLQRPQPRGLSAPLLALALLLMLHLLWGMAVIGMQTAVTVSRPWLYVVGPLVFAAQAAPPWRSASFRPLIFGALALSGYLLIWIAQNGFRGANTFIEAGGELIESRALTSVGVLLILLSLLIAVGAGLTRSPIWWWLVALLGAGVVFGEYRTVWLIAVALVAFAYLKWARGAIFANERAALGAASALLLLLPPAAAMAVSSSALAYSASSSFGADTSLTWRWESWRGALELHHSAQDLILGLPAGTEIARKVGAGITTRSVHSFYLDALLFFGVFGLAILVYLGIQIVRRRREASMMLGISSMSVVLLVVTIAVFGTTTMLGSVQGLLVGILLQGAFLGTRQTADDKAQPYSSVSR